MTALTTPDVLQAFRDAGALLEGHFILSSGRRSPVFLQKAKVFADPVISARLCAALAEAMRAQLGEIDIIASPAVGGIIPGYETARALGCRAFYLEREAGMLSLRRGFEIPVGARVAVVEDIVTTGLSVRETLEALSQTPGIVVGVGAIIDRSGGRAEVGAQLVSLAEVDFADYDPADLPPELQALPPVKPGSRGLK
jgi:orotate phosphoribosyltransferase